MTGILGVYKTHRTLEDDTLKVTIEIDPEFRGEFQSLFVKSGTGLAIARITDDAAQAHQQQRMIAEADATEGDAEDCAKPLSLANRMMRLGYFMNRKLWDAMDERDVYTRALHLDHVRRAGDEPDATMPLHWPDSVRQAMLAGKFTRSHVTVAHHVRYNHEGGMGLKPDDFIVVPMDSAAHDYWHANVIESENEEMHKVAVRITADRMKFFTKIQKGIESLSDLTPEMLALFEAGIGIETAFGREAQG